MDHIVVRITSSIAYRIIISFDRVRRRGEETDRYRTSGRGGAADQGTAACQAPDRAGRVGRPGVILQETAVVSKEPRSNGAAPSGCAPRVSLRQAKRLAITDTRLYTCRMCRNGTAVSGYVPLWCKSNFSFLEGTSHPEELVRRCRELAIPALVLADRDGVYGVVRAHVAAGDRAPRLIIGAQLTVVDSLEQAATGAAGGGAAAVVLLVQCKEGYANLCRLISRGRLRCPKGECRVSWEEVCAHAGGLIALWEGRHLLAGSAEESLAAAHRPTPGGVPLPPLRTGHPPPAGRRRRRRTPPDGAVPPPRHPPGRRHRGALPPPRPAPAAGRGHLHPPPHHAARRRHAAAPQRRARPQVAGGVRAPVRGPPRAGRRHPRDRRSLHLLAGRITLPLSLRTAAGGSHLGAVAAPPHLRRGAPALRRRHSPGRRPATARRAGGDRGTRLLRLLPDHVRDRPLLPRAADPVPGTRLGGQLRGVLLPGHHRRRPGAHGPAVRALPCPASAPSRPTSTWISVTAAAKRRSSSCTASTGGNARPWSPTWCATAPNRPSAR